MPSSSIEYNPQVLKDILSNNFLKNDPFVLFDIGASQGIDEHWKIYSPFLNSYGFDPLVKEMNRLNKIESNPHIKYFDAFIVNSKKNLKKKNYNKKGWAPDSYRRSSAIRASEIVKKSYKLNFNNNDPEMIMSDNHYSIDEYLKNHKEIQNVDFIKIDTDGFDIDVINGSVKTFKDKNVLGLFVECQFQGPLSNHANSFFNIDRELRNHGFSLFDLETYRYSKSVLPDTFYYDIFAQTKSGQILAGDALYIRDFMAKDYIMQFGDLSLIKKIKLITIFELYGLFDCAAEIIIHLQKNKSINDTLARRWLDMLTHKNNTTYSDYNSLISAFNKNPSNFFPHSVLTQNARKIPIARKFYRAIKNLFKK